MKRLLAIALLVSACGGVAASPIPTTSITQPPPVSPAAAPSPSAAEKAAPIDPTVVHQFAAAVSRMKGTRPQPASNDKDWPASQAVLLQQADWYDAFSADLEAISFPDEVTQYSEPLVGWSKELAIVARQAAKADSSEAAMQDTVEFGGDKFPLGSFLQDAAGEWQTSLSLTADALGVDLTAL